MEYIQLTVLSVLLEGQEENMLITISREFGSGGRELGKRLADAFSIPCYDNEIIHFVAEQGGFDSNFIAHAGERSMKAFYPETIASRFMAPAVSSLSSLRIDIAAVQQRILRGFAEAGDCVIVGRAADIILEEFMPFNIFVYASMEARIKERLYLDQFKEDGSADIGADKAMKAWGFDYNFLDFS